MSGTSRFQAGLAAIEGRPFSGKCFRMVALETYLKSPSPRLLYDLGPRLSQYGQRFSPPGDHRGLYVSTEHFTAGSEFADGELAWIAGECAKHVTFDLDVALRSILDLTVPATLRALKTSEEEMASAWLGYSLLHGGAWPPTWILGHDAFSSQRFDGVLFSSTKRPGGTCLLIFTERLVERHSHVIVRWENDSLWERLP